MLYDIIVTALILLCGVAVYFALLGLMVLYNKMTAGTAINRPQESNNILAEQAKAKSGKLAGYKKDIQLGKFVQRITQMRMHKSIWNIKNIFETQDPLRTEHKMREEEFRRKMQQHDDELLRELKQRLEEKRLSHGPEETAEMQANTNIAQ